MTLTCSVASELCTNLRKSWGAREGVPSPPAAESTCGAFRNRCSMLKTKARTVSATGRGWNRILACPSIQLTQNRTLEIEKSGAGEASSEAVDCTAPHSRRAGKCSTRVQCVGAAAASRCCVFLLSRQLPDGSRRLANNSRSRFCFPRISKNCTEFHGAQCMAV